MMKNENFVPQLLVRSGLRSGTSQGGGYVNGVWVPDQSGVGGGWVGGVWYPDKSGTC